MPVFYSPCQLLADFNEGSPYIPSSQTVTTVANAGKTGVGDYGLKVTVNTTTADEAGVRAGAVGGNIRSFKFDFKLPSTATFSGDHGLANMWSGNAAAYGNSIMQLHLTPVGGQYRIALVNPNNDVKLGASYHYTYATQLLNKDTWYTFEVRVSNEEIALYINNAYQCFYQFISDSSTYLRAISLGKYYSTGYTGDLFFDNVTLDVVTLPAAAVGTVAQVSDTWAGWKARYVRSDGLVVRPNGAPNADGQNGSYQPWSDSVSEAQAYGLVFAVQNSDRTAFDLIETCAFNVLERKNNTTAPGWTAAAQHLMGWHYDDANNSWYDINWASDGDMDRMKALYWAHAKWGSAGAVNYKAHADFIALDLQTSGFRQDTVGTSTYQIQASDEYQGSAVPFETNPSYVDFNAYRLAKQYASAGANQTFWQQAIDGGYYLLLKSTDTGAGASTAPGLPTAYGIYPEWAGYNTGTHDVSTVGSRSIDYGYNAFRCTYRVYWDYYFYNETRALAQLTNNFRTYQTNAWTTYGRVAMETQHDGTRLYSGYEKSMNTYAAYLTQKVSTPTTVASPMYSSKLANTYAQSSNGGWWADNAGSNTAGYVGDVPVPSYFNNSWMLFAMMTEGGVLTNYGNTVTTTKTKTYTFDGIVGAPGVTTRTKTYTFDASIKQTAAKTYTFDGIVTNALLPNTKIKTYTFDASILKRNFAVYGFDALIIAAPPNIPTSGVIVSTLGMNLGQLIDACVKVTGNRSADAVAAFTLFLNMAMREVARWFPNHNELRASNNFNTVIGQDVGYTLATDVNKVRFMRIAAPLGYSKPLNYITYPEFRASHSDVTTSAVSASTPAFFYHAPEDERLWHLYPVPDKVYLIQYDYERYQRELVNQADYPFFDRNFHQMLFHKALFYYYNSDVVNRPDKGAQWDSTFRSELVELIGNEQVELSGFTIPYGSGVNESVSGSIFTRY